MSVENEETEVISEPVDEVATREFKAVRSVQSTPVVAGGPAVDDYEQPVAMPVAVSPTVAKRPGHDSVKTAVIIFALVVSIAITGFIFHEWNKADGVVEQQTTQPVAPPKPNASLSLSGLEGEYWSNAEKILDSRDADLNGMVVLTDDGKEPVADANWTVESISKADDGHLEVHLAHETDLGKQTAGVIDEVTDYAKNAWGNLKDGTMGLGNAK